MKKILFLLALSFQLTALHAEYNSSKTVIDHTVTVNPDNSVTFTVKIPADIKNGKVFVNGNFVTKTPGLKKTRHGYQMTPQNPALNTQNSKLKTQNSKLKTQNFNTFTLTTPALMPEMYTYYFDIAGQSLVDTLQHGVVRDVETYYNYFFITDSIVDHYLDHPELPHGRIEKIWYPSTLNGMSQRRLFAYLPAEYNSLPDKHYPVLYLLHGSGGDETSWSDYGRACQILDCMIARGECKPMIVVMPNDNINLDAAPGESPYMNKEPSSNNISSMFGDVEMHFIPEIVRYVEKHFRVVADKQHRAIAGLSLGGLHTLYTSVNNPQTFDYVGLFSPQTSNKLNNNYIWRIRRTIHNIQRVRDIFSIALDHLPERIDISKEMDNICIYDSLETKLERQFTPAPRLYYIAIGKEDFLMTTPKLSDMNNEFFKLLNDKKYPHEFHLTTGNHSWENWRRYLIDFLKKIF